MLQTDRKTDQTRQTAQDREQAQQKQSREPRAEAALALQAILAGGDWSQLSADGILSLSHTMGNAALTETLALRDSGPETAPWILPRGACETAPTDWGGGAPLMTEAPDFGAMSPMGNAAPLAM